MFIRTERLFLRPCWPEEVPELLALIHDAEAAGNSAAMPWLYPACDVEAFLAAPAERKLPRLFVTLPSAQGPRLLGCIGLGRSRSEPAPEIGFWIGRHHWGQGYASEAVRAILALARALGHRRIAGSYRVDNPASARVLAKCGFVPVGARRQPHSTRHGAVPETIGVAIDLASADGDDGKGARAA